MRRQGEIRDQKSSCSEGQEVSGEHRFPLFGKTDVSDRFALAVAGKSKRPNHFLLFVCKYLKVQKIVQVDIFTLRRAGGFKKESRENVRGMRRLGQIRDQKSSPSEGQEVSGEHRFDLFGKNGRK